MEKFRFFIQYGSPVLDIEPSTPQRWTGGGASGSSSLLIVMIFAALFLALWVAIKKGWGQEALGWLWAQKVPLGATLAPAILYGFRAVSGHESPGIAEIFALLVATVAWGASWAEPTDVLEWLVMAAGAAITATGLLADLGAPLPHFDWPWWLVYTFFVGGSMWLPRAIIPPTPEDALLGAKLGRFSLQLCTGLAGIPPLILSA